MMFCIRRAKGPKIAELNIQAGIFCNSLISTQPHVSVWDCFINVHKARVMDRHAYTELLLSAPDYLLKTVIQ